MVGSYFNTASKSFRRDKLYTLINIVGLVVGIVVCVLVALYGRHELSYDTWIPDAERVFRYEATEHNTGSASVHSATSHPVVRDFLLETFADTPSIARVVETNLIIKAPDQRRIPYTVRFVDPNFFDVIDLPLVAGSKETALTNINSILISEATAKALFGAQNPIGETLNANNMRNTNNDFRVKRSAENELMQRDFVVVGIFKDIPGNSHLLFDMIAPFSTEDAFARYKGEWAYEQGNVYTYMKLDTARQAKSLAAQFPAFVDKYLPGPEGQPGIKASDLYQPSLINIQDIHYQGTGINDIKPHGDIRRLYAAIAIAVVILIIASINFVNLTVARSTLRSKEVAVRKIMGANKRQLIFQFLTESLFFAHISMFIAVVCLELIMPFFNAFLNKEIVFAPFADGPLMLLLITLPMLLGFVGGVYPALIVSHYRPANIMRSEQSSMSRGSSLLRTSLVVVQFSIAITLGLLGLTFYQQNAFIDSADLGFSPENKIIISNINEPAFIEYRDAIAREIRRLPGVKGAALSNKVPADTFRSGVGRRVSIVGDSDKVLTSGIGLSVDHHFLQAYEIPLIAGRYFSEEYSQDTFRPPVDPNEPIPTYSTIFSESRLRAMGYENPADAVGKFLEGTQGNGRPWQSEIVGVVADATVQSLHSDAQSLTYWISPYIFDKLTVAYESEADLPDVLKGIEEIWQRYTPERPLTYEFLRDKINAAYAAERQQTQIVAIAALLAITVACTGLYAISAFISQLRSREVVIRRVFGASTPRLLVFLTRQFSKPIFLANLIGWPLGYVLMRQYLDAYPYRIELSFGMFAAVGVVSIIVGWSTVATHVMKMVRLRPADTLRND